MPLLARWLKPIQWLLKEPLVQLQMLYLTLLRMQQVLWLPLILTLLEILLQVWLLPIQTLLVMLLAP